MLKNDQTTQALTDAFNETGITTPEAVKGFVKFASLQLNDAKLKVQLAARLKARTDANATAQTAIEEKQVEINANATTLEALIASQS